MLERTSVLHSAIHLSLLSPMPDFLYNPLPITHLPGRVVGQGLFLARRITTKEQFFCLFLQELLPPAIL